MPRLFTQPLFRRESKKTSKLRVTGLCAGNSPVTGEFPAQMASNAENVSIWWRHRDFVGSTVPVPLKVVVILSRKTSCSGVSIGSLETVLHIGVSSRTPIISRGHYDGVTTYITKYTYGLLNHPKRLIFS